MTDRPIHLDASPQEHAAHQRAEADATMARLNASDAAACAATSAANDAAIAAQHERMRKESIDAASIAALAGVPNLDPVPRRPEQTATPSFKGHDAPGQK